MPVRHVRTALLAVLAGTSAGATLADEDAGAPIATVVVEGSRPTQLGLADAASAGAVPQAQLERRTVYRPGELLEVTPGLIVSQHSGEGKANQFFLRGMNLDHGTDLRTAIDGMPVNQRTHAHGQGWTDLNFLIPELATGIAYTKGPYTAAQGDFAAAGSVTVDYADALERGIASVGLGQNGYARGLLAASPDAGGGKLLYALEVLKSEGPFVHPDRYRKINGVLRYSRERGADRFHVALMGYRAHWNASDQIPLRALDAGVVQGRFDTLDPSDGGAAHRFSLSGGWTRNGDEATTQVLAYVINNQLDLFSNFTYFLDHPDTGDQFNQADRRITLGLDAQHAWRHTLAGHTSETAIGVQLQGDRIHNGLYDTQARARIATTREDRVVQRSAGIYVQNTTRWTPWLRTVAGLRGDAYRNRVDSDLPVNAGTASASLASPKLAVILGPWDRTEFYVNLGRGFHSNDARGTTIRVDPKAPDTPATREPVLVPARGAELGLRSEIVRGLQTSLAVYQLDYDAELLFAGDAGSTADTGRPSRRRGIELSNYYRLASWLTVDGDVAYARARYRDRDPAGTRIPGAIEGTASLALAVDHVGNWFGAVQLRYFGPRPLVEDDSVRSTPTTTLNARLGYKLAPGLRANLEVFNVANRRAAAIEYAYPSRLPGEPAEGRFDVHFHPIESRSVRMNLIYNF